ncbi:hypothetical protein QQF64_008627 [Cirrhinus molitorella]|uniref:Uncharacterized protein n=1 Tax=Cirrhinus molitorella TaxID=172907 RepID=A0ABR3M841_9TELE
MRKLKNNPGHTCSQNTRKQQKGRRQHKKLLVSIARSSQSKKMPPKTAMSQSQESLRWVGVLADPVEEGKRIDIYKTNRRKRYLDAQKDLMKSLACIDNQ